MLNWRNFGLDDDRMGLIWWILIFLVLRFLVWKFLLPVQPPPLSYRSLSGDPEKIEFPKDFAFGASTSAWQVEKPVHPSNWTLFEKLGRAPPHGDACDAIKYFDEDMSLMKAMNMKSYRFGISWSALNPGDGEFNKEYLKNYVDICEKLRRNDIEPIITMWHFEVPAWLEERGGIISDEYVEKFQLFADFVAEGLRNSCKRWITINEPNVYGMMGYLFGSFAPGHKSFHEFKVALVNLMKTHVIAYKALHKYIPDVKASYCVQIIPFHPIHRSSIIENLMCYVCNKFINYPTIECLNTGRIEMSFFGIKFINEEIEGLMNSVDYMCINTYTIIFASINPFDWSWRKECPVILSNYTSKYKMSDFGWTLVPESLTAVIDWVNQKWNKRCLPFVISEHGISDKDDKDRPWFVCDSLAFLSESIKQKGLKVTHYLHWSLIDNYEWADGYTQHFGLISYDSDTQERHQRGSCDIIRKIALQTVEKEKQS